MQVIRSLCLFQRFLRILTYGFRILLLGLWLSLSEIMQMPVSSWKRKLPFNPRAPTKRPPLTFLILLGIFNFLNQYFEILCFFRFFNYFLKFPNRISTLGFKARFKIKQLLAKNLKGRAAFLVRTKFLIFLWNLLN